MPPTPFGGARGPACPRAAATFHDETGPPPRSAYVRPARAEDALALAADLRSDDRRELAALGRDPLEMLQEGVLLSAQPLAAIDAEGRLILIFGVARAPWLTPDSADLRAGAPWMLASPLLESISIRFLRACRGWVDHIAAPFDLLANCVDERNVVHIRWLRWCGFSFLRRIPLGPEQRPFLEFARLPAPGAFTPSSPSSQQERTHV